LGVLLVVVRICAARPRQALDLLACGLTACRPGGRVRVWRYGCGARGRPAVSRTSTLPCGGPATWWLMGWSRWEKLCGRSVVGGRPRGRGGRTMPGAGRGASVW